MSVIDATVNFVEREMAGNDASHDMAHIHRVRKTARRLAAEEAFADEELVDLAALLHDVKVRGSFALLGYSSPIAFLQFCEE